MMRSFLKILVLVILALPYSANAKPIITDLAIRSIDIDHDFTGLDILMFGARNDVGDIVIVVRGPEKPMVVRKKERILGVWTNTHSTSFNDVYQYYSVASTKPLENLRNDSLLKTLGIGVDNLSPLTFTEVDQNEIVESKSAIIREKQKQNLYSKSMNKISFLEETLFRTVLKFPKNIPRGWYSVETYLFSDGQLTSMQSTPVHVSKIGFEAFMFDFAYKYSAFYGILSVLIAVFAGALASWVFRRV